MRPSTFSRAQESTPGHAVCFEQHRAGIYLQLGDPRKALAVTHVCVRDVPDHSLQTLPSVLVRRAVAHEMLGREAQADAAYSRAVHLGMQFAGLRTPVGLPQDILDRLYDRLLAKEPGLRPALAARFPDGAGGDYRPPPTVTSRGLTERERVLAGWLGTDLTRAEIAARLNLSVNTINTQTASIYRKLGVTSRRDAIHELARTGLLNDATEQS
ncbi:helix-turn-helix domain-containing protein [Propionicicella superfundia]|uniref:helix-turn-helix domain-containing protein n=1 Tax=Propionicicella superfundia TaxID=348582 RepID=UPI001B7F7BF5|nr:helix-turn-helix transcriptional regulator [Propionicicella superfundia]